MPQKKIVTWSMFILFLSLAIVYSLAYIAKSEVFAPTKNTPASILTSFEDAEDTQIPVVDIGNTPESATQLSGVISGNISDLSTGLLSSGSNANALDDSLASTESVPLLSGTTQFFGLLDIFDILGFQAEYTLQDSQGNYLAKLGSQTTDFVRTVQQLGGNVYTMATESEILQNQLFGDKVSFINMPVFKDKIVIMVIEIDGEQRLIQVDATKYHNNKDYLKSLFIY
ncbi:MAG: hypothetical protein PHU61_02400 [Candidatus Absconditabacteria bacterium]|nr:hypothetical protein [Candidatus Absconditabacteria bacterium]MDD3868175.1 hypothetical protein [Candidatus Absconditabacteria bacterium]